MDLERISKLRARGGLEIGPAGKECARLSIQQTAMPDTESYEALREKMQNWAETISETLTLYGGQVLPDTLSAAGQTVEALIPIETLRGASTRLERDGLRLNLVESRKIV